MYYGLSAVISCGSVFEVLPFAAHKAVHFLGAVQPFAYAVPFGIKLGKFPIKEGIKAGNVSAHAVCGQERAVHMQLNGFTIAGAIVGDAGGIQHKGAFAYYLGSSLVFKILVFGQHTQLYFAFKLKAGEGDFFTAYLSLPVKPCAGSFGYYTFIVKGDKVIVLVQRGAVAAGGAVYTSPSPSMVNSFLHLGHMYSRS